MGRHSLTGVAPTRTVDEELAANNMTRQDISTGPYRFARVWARLRSLGWHARNGPPLGYDHYYIKPGKDLDGVRGEDYLYGEAEVSLYAIRLKMFEEEDGEPSPQLKPRRTSGAAPSTAGKSPRLSVGSTGSSVEETAASAAAAGAQGSAPGPEKKTQRSSGGAGHAKKRVTKPRGKERLKLKRKAQLKAKTTHSQQGRDEGDAICLLDSDDDSDGKTEELEEKAPAVAVEPKLEDAGEDDGEVKRPASGKRKALVVEDEDDDEEEEAEEESDDSNAASSMMDAGGESDESEDFDSTGSSTRQKKRPKLTTRVTKKQKRSLGSASSEGRSQYEPTNLKDESPPPALKKTSKKPKQQRESKRAEQRPPPLQQNVPPPIHTKPRVVQKLASQFEGAVVKPEPRPDPVVSSPSPPPSRASSVASSQRSYAAPTMASSPAHSASSLPITRLDVDGVTFKSFPEEKYHIVITEDPESGETTIWMEERTSKVQMYLTYLDISKFSEPPKSPLAAPQPSALVYQALSTLLKRVSETTFVDNPPNGVSSDDDGTPFGDFDLVREYSASTIVMEFPNVAFLAQVHRFPLTKKVDNPRVQALATELEQTKQELEAAQRIIEAFKLQNEKQRHELEVAQGEVDASKKQQKKLEQKLKASQDAWEASEKEKETLKRECQQLRSASDRALRRSSSEAALPTEEDTAPAVVPVAVPSPRGKDTSVTFYGQLSWLGTAHPSAAAISCISWSLKWERIVEISTNHYELLANNATATILKLLKRGSYQLNLNVIHQTNRQLVMTITPAQDHTRPVREVRPSTVQVIQTKNKTTHRSRIDRIIECEADDRLTVKLESRNESDALHGDVMVLTSLTAQPNKWLLQFIDGQFLLTGSANGVASIQ